MIIYVAGPYRAPERPWWRRILWPDELVISLNIERAKDVSKLLWREGYTVICPHMNTAHFDGVVTDERFLKSGIEILKRCDAIYMMPGWQKSKGAVEEYWAAISWGLKVIDGS